MNLIRVSLRVVLGLAVTMSAAAAFAGAPVLNPDGIGIYTASGNFWLAYDSSATPPFGADFLLQYGGGAGPAIVGDWDGDGNKGVGIYSASSGTFWLQDDVLTSPGTPDPSISNFSITGAPTSGVIPIVGDWDADDSDEVGIYDPATGMFYLRNSLDTGAADQSFQYGGPGLKPVVGNWNNTGGDGIGVYTGSGNFWLKNTPGAGAHDTFVHFGTGAGTPVAGQWVAGTESIGVYTEAGSFGAFHVLNAIGGVNPPADASIGYGAGGGSTPVVGTWEPMPPP